MSIPVPKVLLFGLLLLAFFNGKPLSSSTNETDCEGLKLTYQATPGTDRDLTYELDLIAAGGTEPYNYILLDKELNVLSYDHSQKKFKKIKAGTYKGIVVDNKDCKHELYFVLK
jgi:hypothetical protein